MNNILCDLRLKNPNLKLHSVLDDTFSHYGQVLLDDPAASLDAALLNTKIPATGNHYEPSIPSLEALPMMRELQYSIYGGMPIQAGFCNGHGFTLNAEEYHKCSEVNYSTTGLVLLLARPECLRNGSLHSDDVHGFYLPPGTLIELYPRVLHFAPCRISPIGFNCLVVLEQGTNSPLEQPDHTSFDKTGLLWRKNKWLICHPDSPQAQDGAYTGISGENIRLQI